MPTYEYHCDGCEHHFDEFQSINDKPLKKCPECGKAKLRRVFGAGAAIIFKGSGFYQTDYRSDSYKQAAKAEQDAAKPATEKSGTDGAKGTNKDAGANGTASSNGKGSKATGKTAKSRT
jgi:putative FmdB family regulatory protein